jgi:signal transduction histidine kinase
MGIRKADLGMDGHASARRWGWHLNATRSDAAAVLVGVGGATAAYSAGERERRSVPLWASLRNHLAWLQLLMLAAGLVVALAFLAPVAYNLPALRATTESLITLLALLGAWLFRAQFAHTRRLRDLLLLGSMALFALIELTSTALPAALQLYPHGWFGATARLGLLLVSAAIATAALTPTDKLIAGGRRPIACVLALSLIAFVAAQSGGLLLHGELMVVPSSPLRGIGGALGHPLALAVVLLTSGMLALAAAGFARRARLERNGAMSWLSGAAVLMTAARLYFLAMPFLPLAWVSPRDGLTLLAFVLIVVAAARQELDSRAATVRAAAIAERRRVACDLHDGLAQDLAFIAAHGARMAEEFGSEHPLAVAARRALAISRGTINELSDSRSATLLDALEAIAHELRDRFGMAIAVHVDVPDDLPADSREHILRIAREAIANAGRHGRAKNVLVSLRQIGDGLSLRVRDDGCGIGGAAPLAPAEGFGLRSMRERAATLGGHVTLRKCRSGGSELEVALP